MLINLFLLMCLNIFLADTTQAREDGAEEFKSEPLSRSMSLEVQEEKGKGESRIASLPNYERWSSSEFEEYLENALGHTSYNFTEMEDLVRQYFRSLIFQDQEQEHSIVLITKEIHSSIETIRGFIYGENSFSACSGLARYMTDKSRYRRFSEILEENQREKENKSKGYSFWESLLASLSYFSLAPATYSPVPDHIKTH